MPRHALYLLMAGSAVLFWSGNAIIGRAAPAYGIPPVGLNFWRWTLALVILLPFAAAELKRDRAALRRGWMLFAIYGAAGIFAFNTLFYVGLQSTTAIQAALIVSVLPVIVLLLSWIVFRQPMTARQAAGAAISIPGAMLVILQGRFGALTEIHFNPGDLWILGSAFCWAAQILMVRYLPKGVGFLTFQPIAIAAGVACMLPVYLGETFIAGHPLPISAASLGFIAYGGLIGGALGFTIWNVGTIRIGAQAAGYLANLYPIFTPLLAVTILGEQLLWYHWVGGVLVLGGIGLATAPQGGTAGVSKAR
jgi:drug/metabolite transporter (DMT)-like permease